MDQRWADILVHLLPSIPSLPHTACLLFLFFSFFVSPFIFLLAVSLSWSCFMILRVEVICCARSWCGCPRRAQVAWCPCCHTKLRTGLGAVLSVISLVEAGSCLIFHQDRLITPWFSAFLLFFALLDSSPPALRSLRRDRTGIMLVWFAVACIQRPSASPRGFLQCPQAQKLTSSLRLRGDSPSSELPSAELSLLLPAVALPAAAPGPSVEINIYFKS